MASIISDIRRPGNVPEKIGKYVIINKIGKGSTGMVYLSHDPYYRRDVAIKVYNTEEDADGNELTCVMIYAPFESFGKIQAYLENNNIEILSSGFERIPQVTKKIDAEAAADVEKLLEKLEEDDDVQNVYHTMEENLDE